MINHLKGLEINSIYDFDNSFSINELLCKFWEKIEETIIVTNESIDILNWIKNSGLSNETKLILEEWHNNGTLTQLINIEKFNEMKEEFTEIVNNYKSNCESDLQDSINSVNRTISKVDKKITNIEGRLTTNANKIAEVKQEYITAINEVNGKATPETQNANDGYRQFYDGLIVQWGSVLLQTSDYVGQTNAIFPKSFKTLYNIVVGMEGASGWMSVSVKERNTTGFTVEVKCSKGANDEKYGIGAVRVNWIAIGEVK